MRRKAIFAGIAIALLFAPLITSAASVNDLQAQIARLLAQIEALQAGGSASTSAGVAGTGISGSGTAVATATVSCPLLYRSLSLGSRGEDVRSLQEYLESGGYLNASATGYFGAMTRAAVGRWQADNDVVASSGIGFGVFGPMSRSYLVRLCGHGIRNQQQFSAEPQSGPAPLSVTFTTSDSITSSSTYSVDFGDGTNAAMTKGSCVAITAIVGGQGGIRCAYSAQHTYSSNGVYVAKLLKETPYPCPSGLMCAEMMLMPAPQVVAEAMITVGPTASKGLTANPTAGPAPLDVMFSVAGLTPGSYWSINFGDGQSASLVQGSVKHRYAANGIYTASAESDYPCLHARPACAIAQQTFGSVTITVSPSATAQIQQLNAPGSVVLQQGGIAEIRNESYYFTLTNLTSSTATIQITPVGCWNSFPSDTSPAIRCMIAVVPIPPQTLSVGQSTSGSYSGDITLTGINGPNATFAVAASSQR